VHSNYPTNGGVHRDDIALLKLARIIVPSPRAYPKVIELELNYQYMVECGQSVRFFGYGQTFENDTHNEYWKKGLQMLHTNVVSNCTDIYSNKNNSMLEQVSKDFIVTRFPGKTAFYVSDIDGQRANLNGVL